MTVLKDLLKYDKRFRVGFIIMCFILFLVILAFFSPYSPIERRVVSRGEAMSWKHPLGTSQLGQDIFWRLTFAIRNTLIIGGISAVVSRLIAIANGSFSGYIGGHVDRIMSTITESFIVIPRLPLLILISFVMRENLTLVGMGLMLALLDWAWPSKRYRAQILSLREREFTFTAMFSGTRTPMLIYKEHFPFLIPYILADIISGFLWAISMEITLSVLGLTNLALPTVGTMVYWARYYDAVLLNRWNWLLSPIVASILIVLSMYFLSESISAYLDPRSRLKRITAGGR